VNRTGKILLSAVSAFVIAMSIAFILYGISSGLLMPVITGVGLLITILVALREVSG